MHKKKKRCFNKNLAVCKNIQFLLVFLNSLQLETNVCQMS